MVGSDPWNVTDRLESSILDAMITRLESRGANGFFQDMLNDYVDAMDIDGAALILDIGCGTGVASRQIARRDAFGGQVLGIDLSPYFVQAASKLAIDEGVDTCVRFQTGDTHGLGLKDAGFDAVIAHTLFSHLSDPLAVLREAKRVVRPGGLIGVFDGDYASLTFEQDDEVESKAGDERYISAVVAQPRVMRRMPRLAKELGLSLIKVFSYVLAETGRGDFWLSAIESFRKLGPSSGVVSSADAEAWADGLLRASEEGVFFGASNYYGYVLRCP